MCVLDAIGNTPLIEVRTPQGTRAGVRLLCKLEGGNPGGSVKDRPAFRMIQAAEDAGQLGPGQTILEATSGNTGIALAIIAAAKGYRVTLCMGGHTKPVVPRARPPRAASIGPRGSESRCLPGAARRDAWWPPPRRSAALPPGR